MKTNKIIQIIACTLLCFGMQGCNSDEEADIGGNAVAVQFGAANIAQPRTTAGGTQWAVGDKVGIFMLKENATLASANIVGGADNKAYKAQSGSVKSGFTPVGGTPIYYPANGKVDFVAYYPHTTPLTNYKLPVDVSNQSDPGKIDVLYSNNATGYDKNSGTVALEFSHAMSKLSFTLTVGMGSPDLTGARVAISNVKTTADVNLATGLVENLASEGTITAHTNATAIVIPQTTGSSCKLTVTLVDGVSKFECDFSTQPFVQGKNHPYTITVDRTGITVSAGGITDWTGINDTPITGNAEKGYLVGDYYPDPNAVYDAGVLKSGTAAIGIVYWLKDPVNGKSKHGKIVSLDEGTNKNWTGAGTWCTDKGTSWYLPVRDELQHLYCAYNGALPITWTSGTTGAPATDATARGLFNSKLTAAGGTGLSANRYWSSSEADLWKAWFVDFNDGYTLYFNKNYLYRVRAVSAF